MAIAYSLLAEWDPVTRWWWFVFAPALYTAGCLVLTIAATIRSSTSRRKPLGERATHRLLFGSVLVVDLLIGALSLQQAIWTPSVGLLVLTFALLWTTWWLAPSRRSVATTMTSEVIERDAATVFSFIADDANLPRYESIVQSVEKLTSGPIGPGTQFRHRVRLWRMKTETVVEVVDYEPNSRLKTHDLQTPSVEVLTLVPGPNGTALRYQYEAQPSYHGAMLGSVVLRKLSNPIDVAMRKASWAKLKQILESSEFDR